MAAQLSNQANLPNQAAQCFGCGARSLAIQQKIPQAINLMKQYVDYQYEKDDEKSCRYFFRVCRTGKGVNCAICHDQPDSVCQLLRDHKFWRTLPDALLDVLLESSCIRQYATGAYIAQEGDEAKMVYLVAQGSVSPCFDEGSNIHTIESIGVGGVFGELPFYQQHDHFHQGLSHYIYSFIAVVDCKVIEIPVPILKKLCDKFPQLEAWMKEQYSSHVFEYMLTNIPFFSHLNPKTIHQISHEMQLIHVADGTTIFQQDETKKLDLFILKSGWVRLNYEWNKREYHICTLKAGDVFGDLGLLKGIRKITARSITNVKLIRWSEVEFKRAYTEHDGLLYLIVESMERYQSVIDNIHQHAYNSSTPLSPANHDELLHGRMTSS
ncbi:MAG: cyclic nucleotide-binding domain-containing protein [Mariprofundaceae bacterium]|nr:cyclic nucleotide-binding domain-containing protein [Mariprofundaceae bacterium]